MRITNSMMVNNLLRNLYKNYTKMDKAQQMLASQKKFLRPSDDPIGVTRSLRLSTELLNMQQYNRNVDDSDSWLSSSEQVIKNMMEVMQRVRELTVVASNETYSPDDRKKVADEIAELKNQIIGLGNTAYAGSYLFTGYKTDIALFNLDGSYDLNGGILSLSENINVNVGISDRISINYVGQKIFGHMATTNYDEYVLKGDGKFVGADLLDKEDPTIKKNKFIIKYKDIEYTIEMPGEEYNSFQGGKFVEDLNEAIVNAETIEADAPSLKYLVKASLENGEIVFRGAREFQILATADDAMDVKDIMDIEYKKEAELTKIAVSDIDDIDNPISHGAQEYRLKALGDFTGVNEADQFTIYYGDYEYKIKMDRDYTGHEDKEFIYDFNKKLAEDSDLVDLKGHLSIYEKDGKFTISADKKFRIDGVNFDGLGFEEDGSGLKSVKIAHSIQGGEIELYDNEITIDGDNNKLYLLYDGKGYTIDLDEKIYDGSSNNFDDLINDIQGAINHIPELKGYISLTGNKGKIQFHGDKEFKLTYGVIGDFIDIDDLTTEPLVVNNDKDKFNIKLGTGSTITLKLEHGIYDSMEELTKAIQKSIDGDMYTRGRIAVNHNDGEITFYSDLPISLSKAANSDLIGSQSSSNSDLMDSLRFTTARQSAEIDKKVESGSATQLIGVLDRLIRDLNNSNTEGISKAILRLDANINNLNAIRAEMGVKSNRLELTKNRIEDDFVNLRSLLSKNQDIDVAEVLMNLQMDQNVYQASLSVGAKIIPLSLVDFLR